MSFQASYYKFIQKESIGTISLYDQFLNWVSGEYDLNQKEDSNGLKIYVSNGWFFIRSSIKRDNTINMTIEVLSKSKKEGKAIADKINSIFYHFKNF